MEDRSFLHVAVPVAVATFATMLSMGMLVPALPALTAGHGGILGAGALLSSFGIARLLTNIPAGILMDRKGSKPSAIAGLIIFGLGAVIGVLPLSFPGLVTAMFLQGCGSAMFASAAMTALVLAAGPGRRGAAMAWFQGALLFAMGIGPVIGGILVARFGPTAPFLKALALSFVAAAAVFLLPGTAPKPTGKTAAGKARPQFTAALIAGALIGFAAFFARVGGGWTLVPDLATTELDMTPAELGWVIGVATLANFLTQPVAARLVDHWGAEKTAASAAVLVIIGLVLMAFVHAVQAVWLGTGLLMTATGAMIPAAGAIALKGISSEMTGRAMGVFRTATDSAMSLGPVTIPAIASLLRLPVADGFLIAAVLLAGLVLSGLLVMRKQSRLPVEGDGHVGRNPPVIGRSG